MDLSSLKLNMNSPISILIGENGCGKSEVLSQMARGSINEFSSVIAIATSVYDKFPRRNFSANYHYMGGRLGRFVPREAIKEAISRLHDKRDSDFSALFRSLNYIGFDQRLGFRLLGIDHEFESLLNEIDEIDKVQKDELERVLFSLTQRKYSTKTEVLWFHQDSQYINISDEFLVKLVHMESTLKKYKIIKSIEIFLSKDEKVFPLSKASSGELSLLSTLIFISSFIDDCTLILIDEPENSLHPKWQKDYISMIMDLFSYYEPKIIAATHSPVVISGLSKEKWVDIHKHTKSGFILDNGSMKNVEVIYSELFDIITPGSRNLSNDCADILNKYSESKISFQNANAQLDSYIDKSFDETQKEFLEGIKKLISQIKDKV
jgi:predicted ATPase